MLLLAAMIIAGGVSAFAGMSMGREALKGITQPDTRPTNGIANRQGSTPHRDEVMILEEDKIIANVKTRTGGKASDVAVKVAPTKVSTPQSSFPMVTEKEGVSLEVKSVQQQGDTLVLSVGLKNTNPDPVKFLYTFLKVKTDQGQTVSANTEGLPSELPPDSESYSGTIRMPMASINKVQKISLSLADYPNQKIQLELPNIPVVR